MKRVCVYCGSNRGSREAYADAAVSLAEVLVNHDIELVYGGASAGIMGVIADAVLERGGRVHGVLPRTLMHKELAHKSLTELHIVNGMHERKSMMAALSDGFIALPGGFGTLEELIEVITWGQLKFHDKPCGLLNVDGYFDALLAFLDHAQREGFLREESRAMLIAESDPVPLIRRFERYTAPVVEKWIDSGT